MSNADELLKYKELLDSGIITQEEFEKKKSELLEMNKHTDEIKENYIQQEDINNNVSNNISKSKKIIKFFLCLFLGMYGAHKFYEKKIGMGILYMFTAGLFLFGWLSDVVINFKELLDIDTTTNQFISKIIGCFSVFFIFCFFVTISLRIYQERVNNISSDFSTNILLDINNYYKEGKSKTITPEELIALKGEPLEKETWKYELNKKSSYQITTYTYPNSEEYNFYNGHLSWILIEREIPYSSKSYILSMFNLQQNSYTKKVIDNGTALRYDNCGAYEFWAQLDNNKMWWVKIKLVESPF